ARSHQETKFSQIIDVYHANISCCVSGSVIISILSLELRNIRIN
ncbi:unnamed protein product, partial [Tenebrio molitor]